MAHITLQVLEGLERGEIYPNLPTPVTIGREDDNLIRLNDERVSRFHAKIQEDGDRVILTDLDSTNGTRVNGHPVQLRVLQAGDQLWIGRSVLIYGSPQEIEERATHLLAARAESGFDPAGGNDQTVSTPESSPGAGDRSAELEEFRDSAAMESEMGILFPEGPPEVPQNLQPYQRAQIADVLAYVHDQIRCVMACAVEERGGKEGAPKNMIVEWLAWQRLIQGELDLATYLRKIADPDA